MVELDAGLLALPLDDDSLAQEVLFEEPFVMAMPGGHPLAAKDTIELGDLVDAKLLLLEDGHCLRDQALEVCALAGARERVDFHATSMETLRQMVAADVGVTLMPVLAVTHAVDPDRGGVQEGFNLHRYRLRCVICGPCYRSMD